MHTFTSHDNGYKEVLLSTFRWEFGIWKWEELTDNCDLLMEHELTLLIIMT